jgi:hypothetical protein
MKALIASMVSLLLGIAIGWYFEHRQAEREMIDAVKEVQVLNRQEAGMDLKAIESIQSGDTQRLVQFFSYRVANFYSWNMNLTQNSTATNDWNDKLTTELLNKIEQFARTNQMVAADIKWNINHGVTNSWAR